MKPFRTTPVQLALPLTATSLQRVDPSRNMAKFYSLEVERDLFGRVVVVRRWGRIGTAGKTRLDEHPDEGRAVAALVKLEASKRRRGYRP
jgi:predicted DNA-binding WGR domain protein